MAWSYLQPHPTAENLLPIFVNPAAVVPERWHQLWRRPGAGGAEPRDSEDEELKRQLRVSRDDLG